MLTFIFSVTETVYDNKCETVYETIYEVNRDI